MTGLGGTLRQKGPFPMTIASRRWGRGIVFTCASGKGVSRLKSTTNRFSSIKNLMAIGGARTRGRLA